MNYLLFILLGILIQNIISFITLVVTNEDEEIVYAVSCGIMNIFIIVLNKIGEVKRGK